VLTGGFTRPFTSGTTFGISRAALPQAFAELNLLSPTLDPRITFTGGPVTYVGADGLLHTSAANEWPLGYDPVTLQPVGRSAWEQRTNLLLNSGAPATQSVPTTAQSYTLSFTGTGTVTLSGTYAGSLVGTGTGPANRVNLTFTATAGTLTVTPSGSVQNFQLEAAGTAGPYIATTSAQVTRAAQVATVNDLTKLRFNASAGTWFAEAPATIGNASAQPRQTLLATTVNVSGNDRIQIAFNAFGAPSGVSTVGGATYLLSSAGVLAAGTVTRIAIGYDASGQSLAAGGSIIKTMAAPVPPANTLQIGVINSSQWANGAIRRIRYYPTRPSDAQLQALTA
jgi:hypothetical protein